MLGSNLSRRWVRVALAAAGLAAMGALIAAATVSALQSPAGGEDDRPTPTNTPTPTITLTPSITPTPTVTLTPTQTPTPTQSPTPFPTKDLSVLGTTVMIGGSTGFGYLDLFTGTVVPMFDGAAKQVGIGGDSAGCCGNKENRHLILPGALTHLSVLLDNPVPEGLKLTSIVSINGTFENLACVIPSKGKGDFCEAGDKESQCTEVGLQDDISVVVIPQFEVEDGGAQTAAEPQLRMSWVAKLNLFQSCDVFCDSGAIASSPQDARGKGAGC